MTSLVSPVNQGAAGQTVDKEESSAGKADGSIVSKDDFLRLLVAQIKNQNPLNPADGVEFLTQLAQFSQLEQLINIREDLEKLLGVEKQPAGASRGSGAAAAV